MVVFFYNIFGIHYVQLFHAKKIIAKYFILTKKLLMIEEQKQIPADVRSCIRQMVWQGTDTRDEIIDFATQCFVDEDVPKAHKRAKQIAFKLMREHRKAQTRWGLTDNDKLDAVFRLLNRIGIVAKQNYACCGNCASNDLEKEMKLQGAKAYCYYHAQDTEHAINCGELWIGFGYSDDTLEEERRGLSIIRKICHILRRKGFEVVWDGSENTRLHITKFKWQRRNDWRS